jgi:hypothetical protein
MIRWNKMIGFKIDSYSYITMEMDMDKMELLQTFKEILAKMDSNLEERKAERKAINVGTKTI